MIVFRTRSEGKYGWGNLVRLSWIASYLKQRENLNCSFIIEGGSKSKQFIKNLGLNLLVCRKNISINAEINLLNSLDERAYIIVEMLDFRYEHQKILRKNNFKVILLDDLLEQRYAVNAVICGQENSKVKPEIIKEKKTNFYYGYEYFPINPSLISNLKFEKHPRNKKKIIGVLLGGLCYDVPLLKITKSLIKFQNNFDIIVVTGVATTNQLSNNLKKLLPTAIFYNSVNVENFFPKLDFAIVGGGYTKIEAYIYRIPSLVISTQYHQIPLAKFFCKITNQNYLGHSNYISSKVIEKKIEELISNKFNKVDYLLRNKFFDSFKNTISVIKKEFKI